MPGSKPGALPLGDTPSANSIVNTLIYQKYGWDTRIRTKPGALPLGDTPSVQRLPGNGAGGET